MKQLALLILIFNHSIDQRMRSALLIVAYLLGDSFDVSFDKIHFFFG
jgi:hypothetical protein